MQSSVITLLTVAILGLSHVKPLVASEQTPDVPQLFFANPSVDLGTLIRGQVRIHRFHYKNYSKEPIRIKGSHAGCGCTVVDIGDEVVAPGEEGDIEVRVDTSGHSGEFLKTILILTDEPVVSDRILTIKARIDNEFGVEPLLVDFGQHPIKGLPLSSQVRVSSLTGTPFSIKKLSYDRNKLTAVYVKDQNDYVIKIGLKKTVSPGKVREIVVIHTDHKVVSDVKVPVIGEVLNHLSFNPEFVDFGYVKFGEKIQKIVKIASDDAVEIVGSDVDLLINGEPVANKDQIVSIDVSAVGNEEKVLKINVSNLARDPEVSNTEHSGGALHGQIYLYTKAQKDRVALDFYALLVGKKDSGKM